MRLITSLSRRRFGQSLGVFFAVSLSSVRASAHDAAHVHEVGIRKFKFLPDVLEIQEGDKVQWTNEDAAPHTATAHEGDWDTGEIKKGQSGEILFDRPGEYPYLCAFHKHMKGRIIVVARR